MGLGFAGGLRVSELVGLCLADLLLHPQPTVHVMGKGRRERVLPLWRVTATALRDWLKVRGEPKTLALFPNMRGDAMTRSGFEYILDKHVRTASAKQPSLAKKRISPHSLRHYVPFLTMSCGCSRAQYFRPLHESGDDIVLTHSIGPVPEETGPS